MTKTYRRILPAALLAAGLLTSCATQEAELPQPTVDETDMPAVAAVTVGLQSQLDSIRNSLDQIDSVEGVAEQRPYLFGPASRVLKAEYSLQQNTGSTEEVHSISTEKAVSTIGATDEYPRIAMVFTGVPEGENFEQLLTVVQLEPRENYALWGFVDLFGSDDASTFEVAPTTDVLRPDDDSLGHTPTEIGDAYSRVLAGEEVEGFTFADDPIQRKVEADTKQLTEAASSAGEVSIAVNRLADGPLALRTAENGAIVMAHYSYDLTVQRTLDGSTLEVGGLIAKVANKDPEAETVAVEGTLTASYLMTVALYVAPGGSTVRVIGSTDPVLGSVELDPSTSPDTENGDDQ